MTDIQRDLLETSASIENIGWTLGNECPFRCRQCYSLSARIKGRDLTVRDVDRVIDQLTRNAIKTVNLGGNEPLFTNGLNPKLTLLPYILRTIAERGMVVGITTAGITANYLAEHHRQEFLLLNDVDVSLDSPFSDEHNVNRGAPLFNQAIAALEQCAKLGLDHTIVMCGMNWNLSERHLSALADLAAQTGSHIRINFLKPTDSEHFVSMPSPAQFYTAAAFLLNRCRTVELGEPLLSALGLVMGNGCPCGIKSFRIHSITPDGRIPVSPCVYLHDLRCGDILKDNLSDIIQMPPFLETRQRHANPQLLGCADCEYITQCRGGCMARAFLANGDRNIFTRDPYCFQKTLELRELTKTFPKVTRQSESKVFVHNNYLCTAIFSP